MTRSEKDTSPDDIHATEEEGREYRNGVYFDRDSHTLEEAPETAEYPKTDGKGRFRLAEVPKSPKLSHLIGPGAIMLGAALGGGESLLWPALVAQAGWTVYWAFLIAVFTQFFINTELMRWTMATGESIFRGWDRLHWIWPWFILITGFGHIGWPSWVGSASQIFAAWTGVVAVSDWWIIGVISLILIWLSYQVGPLMYNVIENVQTFLMGLAVVIAVVLVFLLNTVNQVASVPSGVINFGTIPSNVSLGVLVGAIAAAGAGGAVNPVQSIWAREKGYGMSSYQGRIKNPLRGSDEPEEITHSYTFEPTSTNLQRWRAWWSAVQKEQFLTFVVGLIVIGTAIMSIVIQYIPAEMAIDPGAAAVSMWIDVIIPQFGNVGAILTYALLAIGLFSTQYAVVEVFVRTAAEVIFQGYGRKRGWTTATMNRLFFWSLTFFIAWDILIIALQIQQPWILLVFGAVVAGFMLWVYSALTLILNTTRLPEHAQPGWIRIIAMWWATGFFGYFSILVIGSSILAGRFGLDMFATTAGIMGSSIGGYLLWLFLLILQIYIMYRSARGKLNTRDTVENAEESTGILS
jgi:hypothetical protein